MILRTGIDLVEIDRIQSGLERYKERFLKRIFTPDELLAVGDRIESLAGRFAAKEAVAKVLGTGIGMISWQDIEIKRGQAGEPILNLRGNARKVADQYKLVKWSISISHTSHYAVAMVVAASEPLDI
jgi:holo-[acyl-carrier protein] synthase